MYNIGVDVGGTNIKCGLVNESGDILYKEKIKTKKQVPPSEIISDIEGIIISILKHEKLKLSEINSIGVGIPGICDEKNGIAKFCANIDFKNVALVEILKNKLNFQNIFLSNDANCAVLAEAKFGAGKGSEDCVLITIGTGIGTGIISEGRFIKGRAGLGAEGGHTIINMGGEKCGCNELGHYEAYASTTALVRQTKKAIEKNPNGLLAKIGKEKVSGYTAFQAEKEGDQEATKVINKFVEYLAIGALNFTVLFAPEYIILGGAISNEGDRLTKPVQKYISEHLFSRGHVEIPKVVTSDIKNDAGIIGAAYLFSQA